ncbi:MAG: hypothetical protein ACO2PN_12710 [Pyrobaculum sp.]|jgi:hypothetical protein
MLRLKKGLTNMFEDATNNTYAADESSFQLTHDIQQTVNVQPQVSVQPQPTTSSSEWGELLIRLLATAPEDVVYKLVSCLDNNIITQMLEERKNDPYLKVALLLLTQKK